MLAVMPHMRKHYYQVGLGFIVFVRVVTLDTNFNLWLTLSGWKAIHVHASSNLAANVARNP